MLPIPNFHQIHIHIKSHINNIIYPDYYGPGMIIIDYSTEADY